MESDIFHIRRKYLKKYIKKYTLKFFRNIIRQIIRLSFLAVSREQVKVFNLCYIGIPFIISMVIPIGLLIHFSGKFRNLVLILSRNTRRLSVIRSSNA